MYRTSICRSLALAAVIALPALFIPATPADAAPTVLKRSVRLTAWRMTSYWRDRNASSPEWDTWCWLPRIYFEVVGPVDPGTQFMVEYTMPDGKPWFTYDLPTEELGPGVWGKVESPNDRSTELEKKATLATGAFGFTIRATNELSGANDVLMKGKFTVAKIHVGIAQRPNEFEYYVDQDWRLPLGAVWLNSADNSDSPPLYMGLWVRGNSWEFGNVAGYLFHNGKQIANTKTETWSRIGPNLEMLTVGNRKEDPAWRHLGLAFQGVRGMRGEDMAGRTDMFFLSENPGEYELKILHGGKLVRSMKFTVGSDGRIVDSGVGTEPRPSGTRYLVPVKITGGIDGTWNQNAWKTDAYYGNPYAGFEAIPAGAN